MKSPFFETSAAESLVPDTDAKKITLFKRLQNEQATPESQESLRLYTHTDLAKMRRRLLEDTIVHGMRGERLSTNPKQSLREKLKATDRRIRHWIDVQRKNVERYKYILIEEPYKKSTTPGRIAFILNDGSALGIEQNLYFGGHYSDGDIEPIYSHHVFLAKGERAKFLRDTHQQSDIRRLFDAGWKISPDATPGATLLQFNPRELDATVSLEKGRITFKPKHGSEKNPLYDELRISDVVRIGRPIAEIVPRHPLSPTTPSKT